MQLGYVHTWDVTEMKQGTRLNNDESYNMAWYRYKKECLFWKCESYEHVRS